MEVTCMYRRYGIFYWADFLSGWMASVITIILMAAMPYLGWPVEFWLIPILCFLTWLPILLLYREYYYIDNNVITTKKGKKESLIPIPESIICIYSYGAYKEHFGDRSYVLKKELFISIVKECSHEELLRKIHPDHCKLYTNIMIEDNFGIDFVYSFSTRSVNFQDIGIPRIRKLVVPESIVPLVNTETFPQVNIFIDAGY